MRLVSPYKLTGQPLQPDANAPGPNEDVPWSMRYALPLAALTLLCLLLFGNWLFHL